MYLTALRCKAEREEPRVVAAAGAHGHQDSPIVTLSFSLDECSYTWQYRAMFEEPLLLKVPISAVAEALDIPRQTINSWRSSGLLAGFGDVQGERKAGFYGLDDLFAFILMRELTTGPAGISGTLAAEIVKRSREVLIAHAAGDEPSDLFLILEAGAQYLSWGFTSAENLSRYLAEWCKSSRTTKTARLEVVDIREIAIRACVKLYWIDAKHSRKVPTEEQVRELIEPLFSKIARWYLAEEVAEYRKSASEPDKPEETA